MSQQYEHLFGGRRLEQSTSSCIFLCDRFLTTYVCMYVCRLVYVLCMYVVCEEVSYDTHTTCERAATNNDDAPVDKKTNTPLTTQQQHHLSSYALHDII